MIFHTITTSDSRNKTCAFLIYTYITKAHTHTHTHTLLPVILKRESDYNKFSWFQLITRFFHFIFLWVHSHRMHVLFIEGVEKKAVEKIIIKCLRQTFLFNLFNLYAVYMCLCLCKSIHMNYKQTRKNLQYKLNLN